MPYRLARPLSLVVLIALLTLGLVSCGSTPEQPAAEEPAAEEPAAEEPAAEEPAAEEPAAEEPAAEETSDETPAEEATEEPAEESAEGEPIYGGTLVVCMPQSPRSLVSIIDPGTTGITVLNNTEDGLLNRNEDYSTVYPALAVDFPEVPDPLTYIFKLREGVFFHDGKEMTSEDVKYTYERLLDESYGATFGAVYQEHIDSIETPDDYTVIFHLKKEWPIFLSFVGGNHTKIVHEGLAELPEYGTSVWSGTGPFMITEWVRGESITTVRNPNYWGAETEMWAGQPYLDEVIVREIPDPSAAAAAIEAGQCDVLTHPEFKDLDQFASNPDLVVMSRPDPNTTLFVFATEKEPFNDQKVRKAISMAIDRQEIVDTLFFGYADAATDFFPAYHWAHDSSITVPYDPEGATALLAEAGYDESNPLQFTLMTIAEPAYQDQAVLVQDQLSRIGVEVEVLPIEYTSLSATTASPHSEWPGHAAVFRITPLRGTAFEFTYYQYGTEGGLNRSSYNKPGGAQNPEFEELLREANSYSDYNPEDREIAKPLYSQLSEMWLEDAPGLILNWWHDADVLRNEVKGWNQAVSNKNLWQTVWLDE